MTTSVSIVGFNLRCSACGGSVGLPVALPVAAGGGCDRARTEGFEGLAFEVDPAWVGFFEGLGMFFEEKQTFLENTPLRNIKANAANIEGDTQRYSSK